MDLFRQSIQTFDYRKEGRYELKVSTGTYLVRFLLDNGETNTQRIIIN